MVIQYLKGIKKNDSKLAGLLGTLIIHLIAAIIFMTFKIRNLQQEPSDIFTVQFEEVETVPEENTEKTIQLPTKSVERILQGDNEMLNIAKNLANRSDQTIDREDYINMVKEELIKNGQLGPDNFIDEQKNHHENDEEKLAMETEKQKTDKPEKASESQEMASKYKGPTRIFYDLENRNHIYLPIPIYMCEGSGKVTLTISVNQNGIVEEAKVLPGESTTADQCLIETAISTALMSKFNPDVKSPKIQKGTLTYLFVAQ
ncbi:MAG TPA: hypothetical protein VHO46_07825 [Bacteroidales bacterium]|nr:hypothetical protein [Bacteroidales bacterium]